MPPLPWWERDGINKPNYPNSLLQLELAVAKDFVPEQGIVIYIRQLQLLTEMGILTKKARVFNLLSGIDLPSLSHHFPFRLFLTRYWSMPNQTAVIKMMPKPIISPSSMKVTLLSVRDRGKSKYLTQRDKNR